MGLFLWGLKERQGRERAFWFHVGCLNHEWLCCCAMKSERRKQRDKDFPAPKISSDFHKHANFALTAARFVISNQNSLRWPRKRSTAFPPNLIAAEASTWMNWTLNGRNFRWEIGLKSWKADWHAHWRKQTLEMETRINGFGLVSGLFLEARNEHFVIRCYQLKRKKCVAVCCWYKVGSYLVGAFKTKTKFYDVTKFLWRLMGASKMIKI